MNEEVKFEISTSPPPEGIRPYGGRQYTLLVNALLALPLGEYIKVRVKTFKNSPTGTLQGTIDRKTKSEKVMRQRKIGEYYWLWLEPKPIKSDEASAV